MNIKKRHCAILTALIILNLTACKKTDVVANQPVATVITPLVDSLFLHNVNGYQCYRIPVVLTTSKGSLLAFCEARKLYAAADAGDIDVVFKRSTDNGATWSNQMSHNLGAYNKTQVAVKLSG